MDFGCVFDPASYPPTAAVGGGPHLQALSTSSFPHHRVIYWASCAELLLPGLLPGDAVTPLLH